MNILKIFKATNEEELDKLRGEEYMNEAIDEIKRICRDKNIIGLYNAEKVAKKEMNNRLDYAKQQGYDKGYDEGIEEGIQKYKTEMITQMLKEELSEETIMRITNLTQEELNEFK